MSGAASRSAKQPATATSASRTNGQMSQRLPLGSVWADAAAPRRPAARAAVLEKARDAACSAGAPCDALEAMDRELASLRSEAASSRPLGARLDSAKEKLSKAEAKVQSAQTQLEKAEQVLEDARMQRQKAEEALVELHMEMPKDNPSLPDELVRRTKLLLQRMETERFAVKSEMPQELLSAISAVHEVMNTLQPVPPATVDGPLESENQDVPSSLPGEDSVALDECVSQDNVIDRLDGVDEDDDSALLAIARSLKRARRT